ncbi:MAG: auxin-responsive protein, partial [Oscillospiraceae bacterium]
RITENTITKAIECSRMDVYNWFAVKRYDALERPYMNLYLEMSEHAITNGVVASDILREHLSAYFRYVDSDYKDLKKLLGIDPLVITVLPTGTIESYEQQNSRIIRKINPSHYDVTGIERLAGRR